MEFALWALLIGFLLILLALSGTVLARLPLSTAMLYLFVGAVISPWGLDMLKADVSQHTVILERVTELIVLVSLFTAGLKLSPGLKDRRWVLPIRLALTSMIVTVALIAIVAYMFLGLPAGACILLGGILAPTDPVLASDVQVAHAQDRDRLRFALTGEGGLNDGTAFPFVLIGLGLLGAEQAGELGWRWLLEEGVWSPVAGAAIGAVLGLAVGRLVLFLRREHKEAVGLDDFLAMGLVALSYGSALLVHTNGFLAVFAAGVALRHLEQSQSTGSYSQRAAEHASANPDQSVADAIAVDPQHAPAFMAQAVLGFNQQIERIGELAIVITIGALLWSVEWEHAVWWFVPVLLFLVRPAAVGIGLYKSPSSSGQRWLVAWFGIRGVGSLYYLMYAINHGLDARLGDQLTALTLSVIVTSIVIHGISVTPMMAAYERAMKRKAATRRQSG
ncbi:MAG TPA: sodium:proton antiporter [Ramlibacter sp.]|nr:sodium:proton antiporter [Ramlibacter sp.]